LFSYCGNRRRTFSAATEKNSTSRLADRIAAAVRGSRGQNSPSFGVRQDGRPFVGIAPARTTNHRRMFIARAADVDAAPPSTIVKYPLTPRPKHVSRRDLTSPAVCLSADVMGGA